MIVAKTPVHILAKYHLNSTFPGEMRAVFLNVVTIIPYTCKVNGYGMKPDFDGKNCIVVLGMHALLLLVNIHMRLIMQIVNITFKSALK